MAIEWSEDITVATLADEPTLSDELALLTDQVPAASGAAATKPVPHVVLDFAQVSYVNSSNIAQLLRLSKGLAAHDRSMRLCNVSDEVWSVMLVTGLDKVFSFAPDTLTALASIQIEDDQPGDSDGDAGDSGGDGGGE